MDSFSHERLRNCVTVDIVVIGIMKFMRRIFDMEAARASFNSRWVQAIVCLYIICIRKEWFFLFHSCAVTYIRFSRHCQCEFYITLCLCGNYCLRRFLCKCFVAGVYFFNGFVRSSFKPYFPARFFLSVRIRSYISEKARDHSANFIIRY